MRIQFNFDNSENILYCLCQTKRTFYMKELISLYEYDSSLAVAKVALYCISALVFFMIGYIVIAEYKEKRKKKIVREVEKEVADAWKILDTINSSIDFSDNEREKAHEMFVLKMEQAICKAQEAGLSNEAIAIRNNLEIQKSFNSIFIPVFRKIRDMQN